MKVGDVRTQSFKEVWDGTQRQQVMERLDASKDCNFHCLRHSTNELALDIKQTMDDSIHVAGTEEFDRFI